MQTTPDASSEERMTKVVKLLEKARNRPQNLRFSELCVLAEAFGFEWIHGEGSHSTYPMKSLYKKQRFLVRESSRICANGKKDSRRFAWIRG
jgi:hypothetical protein